MSTEDSESLLSPITICPPMGLDHVAAGQAPTTGTFFGRDDGAGVPRCVNRPLGGRACPLPAQEG